MSKRYNTPHRTRIIKTRVTEEEHADFMERRMRQIDKNRAKKHELTASIPWGAKEGYDLCINTSGREIKTLVPALAAYCQAVGNGIPLTV